MKINKDKHIGRVLFIVEGSRYEFSLLQKIFVGIFHYEYIEKRRNKPERFISGTDPYSRVAVINTKESNIKDITENDQYLDEMYAFLQEKYDYPVEQSAVYFLFDRDPESNSDRERIRFYIRNLKNAYENDNFLRAGQLLLSYPSVESYTITALDESCDELRFAFGKDAKKYIAEHPGIQLNKMDEKSVIKASERFLEYLIRRKDEIDIDNFADVSESIFDEQDKEYLSGKGFRVFSMLTLAFMQLGLLEE